MLEIARLDHVALTVRDVDTSARFYHALGFATVLCLPRATFLRHGEAVLALFPAEAGAVDGKARGAVDRQRVALQHVAFRVAAGTLEQCRDLLAAAGIPTRGPVDHELNRSLYLEDPDGHQLELTHPLGV